MREVSPTGKQERMTRTNQSPHLVGLCKLGKSPRRALRPPALCCHRQEKRSASGTLLSGFRIKTSSPWRLKGRCCGRVPVQSGPAECQCQAAGTTEPWRAEGVTVESPHWWEMCREAETSKRQALKPWRHCRQVRWAKACPIVCSWSSWNTGYEVELEETVIHMLPR